MRSSHNTHPNCLLCLTSLHANLLNNGVSPESLHRYITRNLKRDREEFNDKKDTLSFDERVQFQMELYQLHAFLSLLQRLQAHR